MTYIVFKDFLEIFFVDMAGHRFSKLQSAANFQDYHIALRKRYDDLGREPINV